MQVEAGSVVLIIEGREEFVNCLLVVEDVKSWGVQGYVTVPGKGRAYYRCKTEDFRLIGTTVLKSITEEAISHALLSGGDCCGCLEKRKQGDGVLEDYVFECNECGMLYILVPKG